MTLYTNENDKYFFENYFCLLKDSRRANKRYLIEVFKVLPANDWIIRYRFIYHVQILSGYAEAYIIKKISDHDFNFIMLEPHELEVAAAEYWKNVEENA